MTDPHHTPTMQRTLIWDLPTRLFHWTLASSFAMAWLTSEGDRWHAIHVFAGYLMLGLIGFRLVWGFAGSHFARFASFSYGPKAALAYLNDVLRLRAKRHVGHNPTGSLAIYLLLALALFTGISGVLTMGAEEQQGPAAGLISAALAHTLKEVHEFGATAMLLLVGVHIAGVIVESLLHRENLARAMVHGHKLAPPETPRSRKHGLVAGLMLVAMLGFGAWWFAYAIDRQIDTQAWHGNPAAEAGEAPHVRFVGAALPDNAQWRDECGACHTPFYPALLPARSWQKIIDGQHQHFEAGNDLEMDPATAQAVLKFLVDNAADQHLTEAANKIDRSVPSSETPLRITETPYWIKKHRDISAAVWASPEVKTRSNCAACHSDAEAGTFEDAAMQIPAPAKP